MTSDQKVKCAIGLMSGTSLDGVDAALVWTDGHRIEKTGQTLCVSYPADFRQKLAALLQGKGEAVSIEQELTLRHAEAVKQLLQAANMPATAVDVIGFHGQTIMHRPAEGLTWQMGNGALLAEKTGIDVVSDFRRRDVAAGGEGAPLVPLFHAAVTVKLPKPLAVVNIGGVANVTWIGSHAEEILAFDTGPGNALLDDWVGRHTGIYVDKGGAIAAQGTVDQALLESWLTHPFFSRKPPKSLDRHSFTLQGVEELSLEAGAATLTTFTAEAIAQAQAHFPLPPAQWLITGGGRHNTTLMAAISKAVGQKVLPVESAGMNGDMLEAQAFGFLAVRSLYGLALSLPGTTGVTRPVPGGAFYRASLS